MGTYPLIGIRIVCLVCGLAFLTACQEPSAPAPEQKEVRGKIAQTAPPAKTPPPAQAAAPAQAPAPAQLPAPAKQPIRTPATTETPAAPPAPSTGATGDVSPAAPTAAAPAQAPAEISGSGPQSEKLAIHLDPFEPLIKEEPEPKPGETPAEQPKRRTPMTPLEKIDLSQLRLTAVIQTPEGNKALVEEASGKGYIVSPGTYIGLNEGQVVRITGDKVIIDEPTADALGKVTMTKRELTLPKPFGEE